MSHMVAHLDRARFNQVQWLLPAVVTLHHVEEAVWLSGWSQRAGIWHPRVGKVKFRFAVGELTGLVYLVTQLSMKSGRESIGAYLMSGTSYLMLLTWFFRALAPR